MIHRQPLAEGHDRGIHSEMGCPGPKSRDGVKTVAQLHPVYLNILVQHSFYCAMLATVRAVDMRVGGNSGRCPPEATLAGPTIFPNIAKFNDPFCRQPTSQATGSPSTNAKLAQTGESRHSTSHMILSVDQVYPQPPYTVPQALLVSREGVCKVVRPQPFHAALGLADGHAVLFLLSLRCILNILFRPVRNRMCFRVRAGTYRRRCLGHAHQFTNRLRRRQCMGRTAHAHPATRDKSHRPEAPVVPPVPLGPSGTWFLH